MTKEQLEQRIDEFIEFAENSRKDYAQALHFKRYFSDKSYEIILEKYKTFTIICKILHELFDNKGE